MTAVHIAAANGSSEVFNHLIKAGASLDVRDNQGWTPLMHAAQEGHDNVAKKMISSDTNLDAIDLQGRTALMQAARCGHDSIVKLLIENGSNPNIVCDWVTPLIMAAIAGHAETCILLIEIEKILLAKDNPVPGVPA